MLACLYKNSTNLIHQPLRTLNDPSHPEITLLSLYSLTLNRVHAIMKTNAQLCHSLFLATPPPQDMSSVPKL